MTERAAHIELCFRPCKLSDVAAVHQLIRHTIEECYPAAYAPEEVQFFKEYHSLEAVAQRTGTAYTVVGESGEHIVATGSVCDGHVAAVFVSPKLQRTGIGAAIMNCLENHASSAGIRALTLDASLPSLDFYCRQGYAVIEEASLSLASGKELKFYRMGKRLP